MSRNINEPFWRHMLLLCISRYTYTYANETPDWSDPMEKTPTFQLESWDILKKPAVWWTRLERSTVPLRTPAPLAPSPSLSPAVAPTPSSTEAKCHTERAETTVASFCMFLHVFISPLFVQPRQSDLQIAHLFVSEGGFSGALVRSFWMTCTDSLIVQLSKPTN